MAGLGPEQSWATSFGYQAKTPPCEPTFHNLSPGFRSQAAVTALPLGFCLVQLQALPMERKKIKIIQPALRLVGNQQSHFAGSSTRARTTLGVKKHRLCLLLSNAYIGVCDIKPFWELKSPPVSPRALLKGCHTPGHLVPHKHNPRRSPSLGSLRGLGLGRKAHHPGQEQGQLPLPAHFVVSL